MYVCTYVWVFITYAYNDIRYPGGHGFIEKEPLLKIDRVANEQSHERATAVA